MIENRIRIMSNIFENFEQIFGTPKHSDPYEIFNEIFVNPVRSTKPSIPTCGAYHEKCKPGFVYLIRYGDLCKIGYTGKLEGVIHRRTHINRQFNISGGEILTVFESNCGRGFEKHIHQLLRGVWVRNEFYRITDNELNIIRQVTLFNGGQVTEHPPQHPQELLF